MLRGSVAPVRSARPMRRPRNSNSARSFAPHAEGRGINIFSFTSESRALGVTVNMPMRCSLCERKRDRERVRERQKKECEKSGGERAASDVKIDDALRHPQSHRKSSKTAGDKGHRPQPHPRPQTRRRGRGTSAFDGRQAAERATVALGRRAARVATARTPYPLSRGGRRSRES